MDVNDGRNTADGRVAWRAARQHGLITRQQAVDAGLSSGGISRRTEVGRWSLMAPGTYRIGGVPPAWQQGVLAACLAFGRDAVASHVTAAALWGLLPPGPAPHVTVGPKASARATWARTHRSPLHLADRTRLGPVPVTRIGRTIADCAMALDHEQLRELVDAALDGGRVTLPEIWSALERAGRGGQRGVARRRVVEALAPWLDPIAPGSAAEARLLRRLAQWHLPTPARQHQVRDEDGLLLGVVDVAWPSRLVGLEYDSAKWHGPRRFERDEARHDAIVATGWQLVHTDRLDLRPGEDRLLRELEPLLGTGRSVLPRRAS